MRPHPTSALCLAVSLAGAALPSQQYQWNKLSPAITPLGRADHAMAYDSARAETVLFGGFRGSYLNDMWAYSGSTWRQITPAVVPQPRGKHVMTYDPVRRRTVLIGGTDGVVTFRDVWEWDGVNWSQPSTNQSQIALGGAVVYDPSQGGVFYNNSTTNLLWDGASWTSLAVGQADGGKNHVLVYDPTGLGVVTFYGQETRRFTRAIGWEKVYVSGGFSRNSGYAMAADPYQGRLVLYGGNGSLGGTCCSMQDTEIWLGSSWWNAFNNYTSNEPGPRDRAAMVFDLARRAFVLFGGASGSTTYPGNTWELVELPLLPATFTVFGSGCSGASASVPDLQADPAFGPRPVLGGVLGLRIAGLPPSQAVAGWLGASRTSYGGIPLPLDLGVVSMPGCSLLVSPDLTVPLGTSSPLGLAWWQLSIPNVAALAGQLVYQQVVVGAPGANPLGFLTSNAGEGKLGGR